MTVADPAEEPHSTVVTSDSEKTVSETAAKRTFGVHTLPAGSPLVTIMIRRSRTAIAWLRADSFFYLSTPCTIRFKYSTCHLVGSVVGSVSELHSLLLLIQRVEPIDLGRNCLPAITMIGAHFPLT